jgi:soluble lytic murein transglycosylase
MQILPQTVGRSPRSRRRAARRLYDPAYNIRFGCRYVRDLLQAYKGNLVEAVAAYHAGRPNVQMWLEGHQFREPGEFMELIPIPATRVYVEAVLRDAEIYRLLLAGSPKFKKCG